MSRSLNKVLLIGNLTRDPELRYTPQGTAVCTFGLATNRQWNTDSGEKREDVEYHRVVAWNKLAELCAQLLTKGRKVFVDGRLQTRKWQTQEGQERTTVEVVITDMIILDSRGVASASSGVDDFNIPEEMIEADIQIDNEDKKAEKKENSKEKTSKKTNDRAEKNKEDAEDEDDIPF
jgi:single-strand DNA-binding protein